MDKKTMKVSDNEMALLGLFHEYNRFKWWLDHGSPSYTEAQRLCAKTFCELVERLLAMWRALPKAMLQEVVDEDEKQ